MRTSNQFAEATTGVVYIHSSPSAVCPHVEWALSGVLDAPARLTWRPQPAAPGTSRAEVTWVGPVGSAARLTAALQQWPMLRFEVTEDPSQGVDGQRFCFVPGLGLWSGSTSASGDVIVSEHRLRALAAAGPQALAEALDTELGAAWDEELETFRTAGMDGGITTTVPLGSVAVG